MMTTMAALLGGAAAGARHAASGSELRHPLGITIVGGLIVSQVLTLFTTPVIYLAFDRLARALRDAAPRAPSRDAEPSRVDRSAWSANEHLRALHPPAGRHHAADPRLALAGAHRASSCCRSRRCRRSTSRPSQVSASLPGASPETMAATVATPLERQFGRIAGVTEMTSTSSLGSTQRHAAVRSRPRHRRRRARRAGGDQRRARPAAGEPARATRPTARSIRPTRRS